MKGENVILRLNWSPLIDTESVPVSLGTLEQYNAIQYNCSATMSTFMMPHDDTDIEVLTKLYVLALRCF